MRGESHGRGSVGKLGGGERAWGLQEQKLTWGGCEFTGRAESWGGHRAVMGALPLAWNF